MALLGFDLRARSYIQSFLLVFFEASAVQSHDHKKGLGFESHQSSWARDETNTHGMETGLTRRARVTATFKQRCL